MSRPTIAPSALRTPETLTFTRPPVSATFAFSFSKRSVPLAVWPCPIASCVGASQKATSVGIGVWIDSRVSMMACSGPSPRTLRASTLARSSIRIEAAVVSNVLSTSCKAGGAW